MHLDKLVTVLKSFDEPRLKRLKEYISSPYFRIPPVCLLLFERLAPLHPHFAEKKMQWQNIGSKNPTLSTLSKQCNAGSHLLRAIENFIAQEEWQKEKPVVTQYRLKGFKELQLTAEFEKGFEKEMKQLDKNPEQNFDTFFERHVLTELSLNGFNAKLNRTTQNAIMPIVKTLDEFHALKKLRYLCEALNRKLFFGAQFNPEDVPHLLKVLEAYTNPKFPYAYVFVNVYRMMEETTYEESDVYYRLLKQYAVRADASPIVFEMLTYVVNHCLYWNNRGYERAGSEYLWWIEWKMKHDLLLEKGKLLPVTFRNIISAAQSQNDTARMERIIKTYSPYLPAEHRDTYVCFANGLYQYSLKNYKEAIRFFLMAEAKEEVVFNSFIRLWQWKCLYEFDSNDTDTLYNHLRAFEKYLLRNKKQLQHLPATFDIFINYSTKLLKAGSNEMPESFCHELESEPHFTGKPWLVKQFGAKNKKPAPLKAVRATS